MSKISLTVLNRKSKRSGKTTLYVMYSHQSQKFLINTTVQIEPRKFEKKERKLRGREFQGNSNEMKKIKRIQNKLQRIVDYSLESGFEPTTDYVKSKFYNEVDESKIGGFFDLWDRFIRDSEVTKKKGTIKGYRSCKKNLEAFEKFRNVKIVLPQVNRSFYKEYVKYLIIEKRMLNNTIGNQIKHIKAFFKYLDDNDIFKFKYGKYFKILREKNKPVVLLESEIESIKKVDLSTSENQYLQKYRDIFLVGIRVGLRISDLLSLKQYNLYIDTENPNEGIIRKSTSKTEEHVSIPIFKDTIDILKKYEGKYDTLLPKVSPQKFNKYMKLIAEKAKITHIVEVKSYNGRNEVDRSTEKYNLVTSHCMRRTFVTESLKKKMNPKLVMSITGHKDHASFSRYINLADEEHVMQEMRKAYGT